MHLTLYKLLLLQVQLMWMECVEHSLEQTRVFNAVQLIWMGCGEQTHAFNPI